MPDHNEIIQCIQDFFWSEVLNATLYVLLAAFAIFTAFMIFRHKPKKARRKEAAIVSLAVVCGAGLMVITTMDFLPVYEDYKETSYTLEQNCEVFIQEGANNLLEQELEVTVITETGEEQHLTITQDYVFETGCIHRGSVAYANHSGHIVWYHFVDEGTL